MNTSTLQNLAPAQNEIAFVFNFNLPKQNSLTKPKNGNEEELIQDELDKFSAKINGLINVEKSNPGLVNMKKQLDRIAKDLDKILSKYKITNPDQLTKIRNLQDSLDVLIANYSK
jgi:hypothetical protein